MFWTAIQEGIESNTSYYSIKINLRWSFRHYNYDYGIIGIKL